MESITNSDRKEELLVAERAAEWLSRLKTAGPQERAAFVRWLKESRLHVREVLLATTWDTLLVHVDPRCAIDIQDLINASANVVPVRPGANSAAPAKPTATAPKRRRWPWIVSFSATAATVLLIVAMHVLNPHQFNTAVGEQRAFELADGSIIHLNTQSQVRVDFSPTARDVYLGEGQVIFKVKHDAKRPFRVHVGDNVIQAIGTQFDVYRQAGRTDVAVIEGSVQIIANSPGDFDASKLQALSERTRITAGELVSIVAGGEITPPAPINVVEVNAWQQRRLIFRRHTLEEIASEFNRYNRRLQLRVEGAELKATRFSGVFDADDPESLLKYLASDGRFAFDRQDDELVIRPGPEQEPVKALAPPGRTETI
jgi:transmembrane sensor